MMRDLGHALQVDLLAIRLRKRDGLLLEIVFGSPLVLRKTANGVLRGQKSRGYKESNECFHQIVDASLAPVPDFKKLANSCAFRVRLGNVAITFSSASRMA